eukprot:SAG31_NODE_824_length_11760_cov_17.390790_9_plen_750_part_00
METAGQSPNSCVDPEAKAASLAESVAPLKESAVNGPAAGKPLKEQKLAEIVQKMKDDKEKSSKLQNAKRMSRSASSGGPTQTMSNSKTSASSNILARARSLTNQRKNASDQNSTIKLRTTKAEGDASSTKSSETKRGRADAPKAKQHQLFSTLSHNGFVSGRRASNLQVDMTVTSSSTKVDRAEKSAVTQSTTTSKNSAPADKPYVVAAAENIPGSENGSNGDSQSDTVADSPESPDVQSDELVAPAGKLCGTALPAVDEVNPVDQEALAVEAAASTDCLSPEPVESLQQMLENPDIGLGHKFRLFAEKQVTYDMLLHTPLNELEKVLAPVIDNLNAKEYINLQNGIAQQQQKKRGGDGNATTSSDDISTRDETAADSGGNSSGDVLERPMAMHESEDDELFGSSTIENFSEIVYDKRNGYLSKGVSGNVFKAQWQGMNCAMKVFNYYGDDPDLLKAFDQEVKIMRNLNHENLVRFYAFCNKPPPYGELAILMELMKGSLASLLYGEQSRAPNGTIVEMTDKRLITFGIGIAKGMNFLHSRGVCHRDLKSHNVLYDAQLRIKICDFAFSKVKTMANFESRVGTPQWMAPEVLRCEAYSLSADLYSFGVIVWEMCHRMVPFKDMMPMAVMVQVGTQSLRLEMKKECPFFWRSLMKACWQDQSLRPQFKDVLNVFKKTGAELYASNSASIAAGAFDKFVPEEWAAADDKLAEDHQLDEPQAETLCHTAVTVVSEKNEANSEHSGEVMTCGS